MAFDKLGLGRVAGSALPTGFNIWFYTSTDTIATINTAGYFPAGYGLTKGDRVIINSSTGGTLVQTDAYVVSVDATTGVPDITDGTTLSATNSD